MANKKVKHPIHMHVPTKIGLVVVGIAVLVYVIFLASITAANNHTNTPTSSYTIQTP
jgi:hypothetical protein